MTASSDLRQQDNGEPTAMLGAAAARSADDEATDPFVRLGRFGKYQVIERIGVGGFGRVYRGLDPLLGRAVAIKTCTSDDPRLRQRFLREGQIGAALQHPNIVTIHDLGYEGELPYLVQEYVPGEDLAAIIAREDPRPLVARLDDLLQIAHGLAHAHHHGVLHRDVKPANIRVRPDGQLKILDFGIARLADARSGLTSEGVAVGTVGYLPPEQLAGGDVDERADIFAFGVLAYELISYRRPFAGDDIPQVLYQLLHVEPPALRELAPNCPALLAALVHRCLHKAPAGRPSSFTAIIGELEAAKGLASGAVTATTRLSTNDRHTRHRPRWPGLTAAGTLVLVAAVWQPWRSSPATTQRTLPPAPSDARAPAPQLTAAPPPATATNAAAPTGPESQGAAGSPASPTAAVPTASRHSTRPTATPPPSHLPPRSAAIEPPPRSQTVAPSPPSPTVAPLPGTTDAEASHADTRGASVPAAAAEPPPPLPATSLAGATEPPSADAGSAASAMAPTGPVQAAVATPPRLLARVEPTYPGLAQRRRLQGQVVVGVYVDEEGRVVQTLVKSCTVPDVGFEETAREAARRSRFAPARIAGQAVRQWTEIQVDFSRQ